MSQYGQGDPANDPQRPYEEPPQGGGGWPGASEGNPYGTNPYGAEPYAPTPYAGGYGSPYGVAAVQHPQAVTLLVLGILGVVVCPFVGIAAFVTGSRVRREIAAEPHRWSGQGMVTAGWVLGIIATVSTGLAVLGGIVVLVVLAATSRF